MYDMYIVIIHDSLITNVNEIIVPQDSEAFTEEILENRSQVLHTYLRKNYDKISLLKIVKFG